MGERNTISSSFTVNTIEDGKDGVVYEITSGISSVTVPSDGVTTTLATTLYFWKRVGGGERTAYSCYATLFRKKGNSLYAYSQSSGKVTSWAINQGVPSSSYDAVVVCIYDAASTAHSGYLAELVIPVIKNGDTGPAGEDGQDGQDAATLVFEPDTVFVPCDADGSVTDTFSLTTAIYIEIKGVRYAPDANTATVEIIADYVDTTWGTNRRSLTVELDGGVEDFEGYIKVTATKTLDGVTYTATGLLPVVALKKGEDGPRGLTGPMSYLAGDYDATVNYGALLTDTSCPVVHFVNGTTDEYWYPTEDYMGAGYPPSVANGWQKANNFEMVVTKILFTQFAKLGGFVVSGDYMLSQYGELFDVDGNKLTLTQSTDSDGSTHWRYNGVDAYTYFCEADPMVEHEILPWVVRNNWSSWSSYITGTGEKYTTLNETSDAKFSELRDLPVGGHYYLYGTDTNGKFYCLLMRKSSYNSTNKRLYGYREKILDYPSMTIFRPVKVVNAATGEEWMSSGKVHVSADGDVTVEGTVKAKNLYHGVCVFIEGGIYSTQWYYVAGTSDWISSKGLSVGDYVEITDAMRAEAYFESTNLLPCTYDADVISMNPNGSANWGSSNDAKTVLLPDPKDFPGKIVEVTSFNYGISAKTAYVGCVVENAFALKVAYNSTSKTVINDTGASVSSITISTGSLIRLLSIYASNQYWWLRIQ